MNDVQLLYLGEPTAPSALVFYTELVELYSTVIGPPTSTSSFFDKHILIVEYVPLRLYHGRKEIKFQFVESYV